MSPEQQRLWNKYQMGEAPQLNNPIVDRILASERVQSFAFARDGSELFDPVRCPRIYEVGQRALRKLRRGMTIGQVRYASHDSQSYEKFDVLKRAITADRYAPGERVRVILPGDRHGGQIGTVRETFADAGDIMHVLDFEDGTADEYLAAELQALTAPRSSRRAVVRPTPPRPLVRCEEPDALAPDEPTEHAHPQED